MKRSLSILLLIALLTSSVTLASCGESAANADPVQTDAVIGNQRRCGDGLRNHFHVRRGCG